MFTIVIVQTLVCFYLAVYVLLYAWCNGYRYMYAIVLPSDISPVDDPLLR